MIKNTILILLAAAVAASCLQALPDAIDANLDHYSKTDYGIDRAAVIRGEQ